MPDFWLGVFDLGETQPSSGSMAEPLLARDLRHVAIEVIRMPGAREYAVLFSRADGGDPPGVLECRIGFTNGARGCIAWRDRGFPLVDAEITLDAKAMLTVRTPYFGNIGAQGDQPPLVVVGPIEFGSDAASTIDLAPTYLQDQQAPDAAQPATLVRRRGADWQPVRRSVMPLSHATLTLRLAPSRSPSMTPLATRDYPMEAAWCGTLTLPRYPQLQSARTDVTPRADAFGVPAFRFEDVEALGFRIDLPDNDATRVQVEHILRPLNFHLSSKDPARAPDFCYRAAGASIVIELLRYGRMRLMRQDAPLTLLDYQSQHELVVRLVVGRFDDDGSPMHDQAVFVPAIFVDNPWSKILGRDMQGFPKALADFCVDTPKGPQALAPDGRLPGAASSQVQPLADISSIRLRDATGGPLAAESLLDLDVRPEWSIGWDVFQTLAAGPAIAALSLGGAISQLGYLASFLRTATGQIFNGFRSVQSSPLGLLALDRVWVTGRFAVDDVVQLAFPLGSVRLTFNAPAQAPAGWKKVCRLLAARPYYDLHVSSWYRLRFSMTMTVDDGLEWSA